MPASNFQPHYHVLSMALGTGQPKLNGQPITDDQFRRELTRIFRRFPACLTERNDYNVFWSYPAEHYEPVKAAAKA